MPLQVVPNEGNVVLIDCFRIVCKPMNLLNILAETVMILPSPQVSANSSPLRTSRDRVADMDCGKYLSMKTGSVTRMDWS